jgi:hypothetical protein
VGHSVRALIAELEHLVAHPERANQPARPRTVMIDKRPDTPGTEVAPGQEASTGSYPGQPNPASPDKPNEPHPYAGYQDATEAVSDVDAQQQPDAVVGAVGEDRQNTDENEVDYQFDSGQLADASEVAGQPKALERPRIKKASGDEKGVGIGG